MKKSDIVNLIKYYSLKDDSSFRNLAMNIANEFDRSGDTDIAHYIMALLSDANIFVPQGSIDTFKYLNKVEPSKEPLLLPDKIKDELVEIANSNFSVFGINKFLFYGNPGTGKTETAKVMSKLLGRILYEVAVSSLIDSKLGQTSKNLVDLFNEIDSIPNPNKVMILFDEIDSLVLDRINSNDLREMGRVTSTFLKALDEVNPKVIIVATTNLYSKLDKALLRRFDRCISFDDYTKEDLVEIAQYMLDSYLKLVDGLEKNSKLSKKIFSLMKDNVSPSDIKNLIKISVAFSNKNISTDYLVKLYENFSGLKPNILKLSEQGFTLREIEILTGTSKSEAGRKLRSINN